MNGYVQLCEFVFRGKYLNLNYSLLNVISVYKLLLPTKVQIFYVGVGTLLELAPAANDTFVPSSAKL